jgi:hypothetical protein
MSTFKCGTCGTIGCQRISCHANHTIYQLQPVAIDDPAVNALAADIRSWMQLHKIAITKAIADFAPLSTAEINYRYHVARQ